METTLYDGGRRAREWRGGGGDRGVGKEVWVRVGKGKAREKHEDVGRAGKWDREGHGRTRQGRVGRGRAQRGKTRGRDRRRKKEQGRTGLRGTAWVGVEVRGQGSGCRRCGRAGNGRVGRDRAARGRTRGRGRWWGRKR